MRTKLSELLDKGYGLKLIANKSNIEYFTLYRYYKNTGRDLMPEEEAKLIKVYHLFMEAGK